MKLNKLIEEERIEQVELLEDDLYMNSPLTKLTHEECRALAEFLIDSGYSMPERWKDEHRKSC